MSNEVKLAGISSLPIDKVIESLSSCYSTIINNNGSLKDFPSVMLWGQAGVGKSQGVKEIGKNIELETGKKVFVQDIRLLLFNPVDLRGIPCADEKHTKAIWLTPEIFQLDPSEDVVNILFLDELSAAPQSVQAAAYQLVLDRKVGEHTLPDNTIVIAAGNRVTDKSVAFKMPKALANRFLHFEITCDFEHWKKWAMKNGINPIVMGFLSFRPDYLNTFDPSNDLLAFATPRSWELVSNIFNNISEKMTSVYNLISGLIGLGIAVELKAWYKLYCDLPKVSDIFAGKTCSVPTDSSALFALCCSLIKHASNDKLSHDEIINSIKYASQFPKEFLILLVNEYLNISDKFKKQLTTDPTFVRILGEKSLILNGQASNGYFKHND